MREGTIERAPWEQVNRVLLLVRSTEVNRPLTGDIVFHLHPTFSPAEVTRSADSNGEVKLSLIAWGAFTVGVVADQGALRLELDLADLADAPRTFRER